MELNLKSEKIFSYRKKQIIDKNEQVCNRKGNNILNEGQIVDFFKKAIDGFLNLNEDVLNRSGEDIIFSRSLQQAVIIEWRELYDDVNSEKEWERYFELANDPKTERHFSIIEFLPRNKISNPTVACHNNRYSLEFCAYIDSLLDHFNQRDVISPENEIYDYNPLKIEEIVSPRWDMPLNIIFVANKLWDISPWSVVEVE